ncbi:hypothetical protein C0991_000891, partial [Blastosporella zonata]
METYNAMQSVRNNSLMARRARQAPASASSAAVPISIQMQGSEPEPPTYRYDDFVLNDEEHRKIDKDPDAGVDEDHGTTTDEDYLNIFAGPAGSITSTPVQLPPCSQASRASGATLPSTPFRPVNSGQTPQRLSLTRRTHFTPPVLRGGGRTDENTDPLGTPLPSRKRSREITTTTSDTPGGEDDGSDNDGDDNESGGHRNGPHRLRASNLNPTRRRIFDRAIVLFKLMLMTMSPYPSDAQADEWALNLWNAARRDLMQNRGDVGFSVPTPDEMKLIKNRIPQLRGQVRDKMRDKIVLAYGLHTSGSIDDINFN